MANGAGQEKVRLNRLGVGKLPNVRKVRSRSVSLPVVRYWSDTWVGSRPLKAAEDFARAIASLPLDLPIRFEFRGPVHNTAERGIVDLLKGIVRDDARVNFAPSVLPDTVYGVLASYDVLCCPSVCVEGGPTVALEAHAVGTPVIGTRIGGLAEIISDGMNGRLVPPGDWRALARVLIEVAKSPHTTIDKWRTELRTPRTMDQVSAEYLRLFTRQVMTRK